VNDGENLWLKDGENPQIDPLALKSDTVDEVVEAIRTP
jgi:hypothetical protein